MKLVAIMWASYLPLLKAAAEEIGVEVSGYTNKQIGSRPEVIENVLRDMQSADLALFYHTSEDFWNDLDSRLSAEGIDTPRVVVGPDPSYWTMSTTGLDIPAQAQQYVLNNGKTNLKNLLKFLSARVLGRRSCTLPRSRCYGKGYFTRRWNASIAPPPATWPTMSAGVEERPATT